MATSLISQSSSVILCKRQKHSVPDFNVLMVYKINLVFISGSSTNYFQVKRQKASRAFPGAHVFPGGVVDNSDYDLKGWGKVFKDEHLKIEDFSRRICTIRELFEETNILLSNKGNDIPPSESTTSDGWFIKYCIDNKITPSIEKLIPFAQWITPLFKVNTMKRFDTLFYILEVEGNLVSNIKPNLDEISSVEWLSTKEVLNLNDECNIKLAPPTYMKILQMNQFERLDDLLDYSKKKKVSPIMPVIKESSDGSVYAVLPGDSEYPDSPNDTKSHMRIKINRNGKLEINKEIMELIITSKL